MADGDAQDIAAREHRIEALFQQGLALQEQGLLVEAAQAVRHALELGAELTRLRPEGETPSDLTVAGGLLYLLGGLYGALDRPEDAELALDGAEDRYRHLLSLGLTEALALIADVCCRRAVVRAARGAGASAVQDADRALGLYADLYEQDFVTPLDYGRVLALSAPVLAEYADAALARAAAHRASNLLLAAGGERVPAAAPYLRAAAEVLAPPEGARAPSLADRLTAAAVELGAEPSAADRLAALAARLDGPLTGPQPGRPVRPGDRLPPELAPDAARELAELAVDLRLVGQAPELSLRLALEAHYLFEAVHREHGEVLRDTFGDYAPAWLRALHRATEHARAQQRGHLARDLSGWAAGVADALPPTALRTPAVVALTRDVLLQRAALLRHDGDHDEAEAAEAAARGLA